MDSGSQRWAISLHSTTIRPLFVATMKLLLAFLLLLVVDVNVVQGQGGNYDQFTYRDQGSDSSSNPVYPPEFWNRVRCNDLGECVRSDCFVCSERSPWLEM